MNKEEIKKIVLNESDVKEVEFIFENNESMKIYEDSIEELNMLNSDFKCKILLNSTIDYNDVYNCCKNPFERILENEDITQVNIKTKQDDNFEISIDWYDEEPENLYSMPMNNELQTSRLFAWNQLELNILNI